MEEWDICGLSINSFHNYLNNKTNRAVIGDVEGDDREDVVGVPKGFMYDPVGYIMHVTTGSNVVEQCSIYLCADDMCLYCSANDIPEIKRWSWTIVRQSACIYIRYILEQHCHGQGCLTEGQGGNCIYLSLC